MRTRFSILVVFVMVLSVVVLPLAPAGAASLQIDVNYAGDWVAGVTDIDATVEVFVSDAGGSLKGDAVVNPDDAGFFFVSCDDWFAGECPDIVPGDVVSVYSSVSGAGGVWAYVDPVGEVTAVLDAALDTVVGTLTAPWLTGPLDVSCEVWEEDGPSIGTTAATNGGEFSCDFSETPWDLVPGQTVAVRYFEPDGDSVINTRTTGTMYIDTDTVLNVDHRGPIVIEADGVTFECDDEVKVIGNESGTGILLSGRTGVTVKNCDVSGFSAGVAVEKSSGNTLVGNTSHDNKFDGFALFSSSGNTLVGNSAYDNTWYGFGLENASGNTLRDNTASGDQVAGFFVGSFEESFSSSGNLLMENIASGNRSTVDSGAGDGFSLVNATGNTLTANSANGNASVGIALNGSFDNVLKDNSASGNEYAGFYVLEGASGNTLKGNSAHHNGAGYELEFSANDNTLKDNEAFENDTGFGLEDASGNTLKDNHAYENEVGFFLYNANGNLLKGNWGCNVVDVIENESTNNTFKDNHFSCPA